jgi:peroxiredoxin
MSFTLPTGVQAPDFELPGHDGRTHRFADVKGPKGTLVFFTCNHCPYVVGSEDRMLALLDTLRRAGISMVAIHSNETHDHPEDSFDAVKQRMKDKGFGWLSLHDESQLVARAYGAERTPHYFLFDAEDKLFYSGRMDNSPRDASKVQTSELRDALEDLLEGRPARVPRTDAIGCNVKWWDKEKHWMPGEACDLDYLHTRKSLQAGN